MMRDDDDHTRHRKQFDGARFGAELGRWMRDNRIRMGIRDRANAIVTKATGKKARHWPGIARNDNKGPDRKIVESVPTFRPGPQDRSHAAAQPPVKNPEAFKVTTNPDGIYGAFGTEERPPRTAKLVAPVNWSWSPANSRCDRYLICTDRHR